MTANMFEPDVEPLVTFSLELTPAEMGWVAAATRMYGKHQDKTTANLRAKIGEEQFDPSLSDERRAVAESIKRKIRKAGWG